MKTITELADIVAAAAHSLLKKEQDFTGKVVVSTGHDLYDVDAPAREAFVKAVLDAVGYELPVDPEREAFEKWSADYPNLTGDMYFEAWKAGREMLRKGYENTTKADDDGWIPWAGGERPVHPKTEVEVEFRDGGTSKARYAGEWDWSHTDHPFDIVAYRLL